MSAIHDALRRAAETDRRRRATGPAPVPPPKDSVAPSMGPKPRRMLWGYLLLPFLGAGIWWGATRQPAESALPSEPAVATRVLGTSGGLPGREVTIATPHRAEVTATDVPADSSDREATDTVPEPAEETTARTTAAEDSITQIGVREEPGEHPAAGVTLAVAAAEESERDEPDEMPENLPEWRLQSIILRNRGSLAMINGQTVMAGEEVNGGRVLKITRDAVVVEWGGRSHRLELAEP